MLSSAFSSQIKRFSETLQLDRPLVYALGARVWQAFSGPVTIAIIVLLNSLNLAEQGIYYSLANILAIQMFFELGLLNILVSQAGLAASNLDGQFGRRRTSDLLRAALVWFRWASILFAVTALWMGWLALERAQTNLAWKLPFVFMVAASAVSIALSPAISVLEGAGFRAEVYRMRFWQMVVGNLAVWTAFLSGFKLWALVASSTVQMLFALYLVCIRHARFFRDCHASSALATASSQPFSWTRDVMPLLWRIALLSAVYHFATQFFPLIVLWFQSKEAAGQLGMTLSVTGAIQSMALAWLQTKFSLASQHHGAGDRETAGTMWRRMALISTTLLLLLLAIAIILVWLLPLAGQGIENRFITPVQITVLAFGIVANHLISVEGFYVMSRGSRPLLPAALIGFTATGIAVWIGGYLFGTDGVLCGYSATTAFVTLPLHTLAYLQFRKKQ